MRHGDFNLKLALVLIAFLLLFPLTHLAFGKYYYFGELESGWNTGLRTGTTVTLDVSGFSMGHGNYSRYAEIGLNDVRVRDRTSSINGTLVYREGLNAASDDSNDVTFDFTKPPGAQDWYFTVNETWPAHISAYRTLDFSGKMINDREYFGNNYENTGSSFLYATDLRKDTAVTMDLKNVYFNAIINDTNNQILKDQFRPNLTLLYDQRSSFTGIGSFRTQHSLDRKPAVQDEERYWGTFTVSRHINSTSKRGQYLWLGANVTDYANVSSYYYDDWLSGCCAVPDAVPLYSLPTFVEAREYDQFK